MFGFDLDIIINKCLSEEILEGIFVFARVLELVVMSVLETDAGRREGSSPSLGTKCRCGEIGKRTRFKPLRSVMAL